MSKTMHLIPHVSEKTYATSANNVYVFRVPADANKVEVARAVAVQFGVEVVSVNITVQKGKEIRFYRNRKFGTGERSDLKKAYVRLKEGHSIPLFATPEEEKQPEKTEKAKAAKKGSKE